jgi:hypothetical protein
VNPTSADGCGSARQGNLVLWACAVIGGHSYAEPACMGLRRSRAPAGPLLEITGLPTGYSTSVSSPAVFARHPCVQ